MHREVHENVVLKRIEEILAEDTSDGFCVECGEEAAGIEPDAADEECAYCGKRAVYGAEQLLLEGLYQEERSKR